jgi:putative ABC transport system permease protein
VKDLALSLAGLGRKKLRTGLLIFAVFIAFLIYAVLAAFSASLTAAASSTGGDRLTVSNKINFTQSLPLAYVNRVSNIEGVKDLSYSMWFGGYYQEQRNFLIAFAVEPESYMRIYSEYVAPPEQVRDFVGIRDSVMVGRTMADRFGWKLGQQIPLSSNIWTRSDGTNVYPVVIRGIFDGATPQTNTDLIFIPYEYFDEARAFANDQIGNIHIVTAGADQNDRIIGEVDALFANSRAETRTTTEAAFQAAFVDQQGNIGLIVLGVMGASFVTILLIVGNAMAGAIRERTGEIAVMKTVGFTSPRIAGIVIGETLMIALIGGLIGLALAWLVVGVIRNLGAFFGPMTLTPQVVLSALGLMVLLGLLTGAIPAWNAMRVNVVTAFRRI